MEPSLSTLQYQPLDSDSEIIRVVIIEPGDFDSPIRCKLQHVDLDQNPWYEALSYVWGHPDVTLPIHLEDTPDFSVTTNLERALRYLRRKDAARVLWIDAICIDLRNMPERGRQVQKMSNIYESASRVLLWVGEENDPDTLGRPSPIPIHYVFNFMSRIVAIVNAGPGGEPPPYEYDQYEQHWMAALVCFEGRPWFKRLWIVQEAVLNSNTELICGHQAIPWSDFRVGFITAAQNLVIPLTSSKKIDDRFRCMTRLDECRKWTEAWRGEQTDVHVLDRIVLLLFLLNGDFQSKDPRDRLFAILGIVSDRSAISQWPGLTVSYEKTEAEVFRDLAITIIEDRKSLAILAGYDLKWRHTEGLAHKPSWVPTWGFEEDNCNLRKMAMNRIGDITGPRAIVRFSEDKNTLFAQGVEIGKIATVGPRFLGGVGQVEALATQFQNWEATMLGTASVLQRFESPLHALLAWEWAMMHSTDGNWMQSDSLCYDFLTGRLDVAYLMPDRERNGLAIHGYIEKATKRFEHKRPLILDSGDIGMAEGVDNVKVDDVVCLLQGAPFPFLLRKEEVHYTFVGNCFFHELMGIPGEEVFVGAQEFAIH